MSAAPAAQLRVVVATDGSEDAGAAVGWLTTFPLPSDAQVRIITAVALPRGPLDVPQVHDYHESLLDEARRVGEAARASLAARWPHAEARVVEGDPREEIVRFASEWRAGLLVVGARGLGAVSRFLLGSVSTAVAYHAPCPVLVVRGAPRPLRGILVGLDGSEHALVAARFLAALPLDRQARVRLLGVVERHRVPATAPAMIAGSLHAAIEDYTREQTAHLEGVLAQVGKTFADRVAAVDRSVVVGLPGDVLVHAAEAKDIDLLVVGARGLGALKRLVLGSVSERVLHHAPCSVLVVHGPPAPGAA